MNKYEMMDLTGESLLIKRNNSNVAIKHLKDVTTILVRINMALLCALLKIEFVICSLSGNLHMRLHGSTLHV